MPRDWTVVPAFAWAFFVVYYALGVTQLWPVCLVLQAIAAALTYRERRRYGFSAIWWTLAVLFLGALAFLVFVYKRSRPTVAYPPGVAPSGAEPS